MTTTEDPFLVTASIKVGINNPKLVTKSYFDKNEIREEDIDDELLVDTVVAMLIEPLEEQLRDLLAMEITMIRRSGIEPEIGTQ